MNLINLQILSYIAVTLTRKTPLYGIRGRGRGWNRIRGGIIALNSIRLAQSPMETDTSTSDTDSINKDTGTFISDTDNNDKDDIDLGHTGAIVLQLALDFLDKDYSLFVEKYYNSVALTTYLAKRLN